MFSFGVKLICVDADGSRAAPRHRAFGYAVAFSRRAAPEFYGDHPPLEGVGNAGCQPHPQPRVGRIETTRVSHHGYSRNHPAFPHANGFNGFLRALPGDRAFLSPSPADHLCRLDASVEASEPHDFAVRFAHHSSKAPKRPPHPAPNVRDDRETPLLSGWDGASF